MRCSTAVLIGLMATLVNTTTSIATETLPNLGKYSENVNVGRLQKYVITQEDNADLLKKTSLLAGYAIVYGFAMKPGGAEKFSEFSNDCYLLAFASGEMKYILNCYITINVVVNQIERSAKVEIKGKFDDLLLQYFSEQGITDPEMLKNILAQFDNEWRGQNQWIETLTVEQAMNCIENGLGKGCKY